MTGTRAAPRRLGRPRDPAADEAIITAVFDVLAESGFAGFTIEAVAARAGVGKATIYRRWAGREELLVAAADRIMTGGECPDTGSLRDDLIEWVWRRHRRRRTGAGPRLLGQVVAEAHSSPELKRMLARFHAMRREQVTRMVDRAVDRGEVPPVDAHLLLDMLSGTLLQRSLYEGHAPDRPEIEVVVDAVLRGVGASDQSTS